MSKMNRHMVHQRETGGREDLTEEIMLVESALSSYVEESFSSEAFTNNVKELEEAWDRIKRSVTDV